MCDVVDRRDISISTRWEHAEIEAVRAAAKQETEGNVSQMIRKLVREALAARSATVPPRGVA